MKVSHFQALELLQCLCRKIKAFDQKLFDRSFRLAAQYGNSDVLKEIFDSFPNVIQSVDENNRSAFHLAVMYRQEDSVNVINDLSGESFSFLSTSIDTDGNNILHLAAYRAKQNQLDHVSKAVLQMQRELQWFQVNNLFNYPTSLRKYEQIILQSDS